MRRGRTLSSSGTMRTFKAFGPLILLLLLASSAWPQVEEEIPIEVFRLSDRVLVLREDVVGNNVTAIASKKGLVIVDDSGFPSTARKMRAIIEREFKRTDFAYVINTHFHWDHAWGNQVFPEATVIGHTNCAALMDGGDEYLASSGRDMRRRLEEEKALLGRTAPDSAQAQALRRSIQARERSIRDRAEGFAVVLPQTTFDDRLVLDLGDLTLKMYFFGRAHSGMDIFVHVPEEGVLVTGDVFLDRRWLPLFAGLPDLDVPRWIEVLHTILDGEERPSRIITGHLDLWTVEKLDLWRDYIVDNWSGLQKARAEGLGFEEAAARLPLGEPYHYLRQNGHSDARLQEFHRENLEAFWSQMVESAARSIRRVLGEHGIAAGLKEFKDLKAAKSRAFFSERQFNRAGYAFLEARKIDEAITVFKMSVELYPKSWNVYDSLAEAYAAKGKIKLAIGNYQRSLELNPDNQNAKAQLLKLRRDRE